MDDEKIVQAKNSKYMFHACKPTNEEWVWQKAKPWCSSHQSLELLVSILRAGEQTLIQLDLDNISHA